MFYVYHRMILILEKCFIFFQKEKVLSVVAIVVCHFSVCFMSTEIVQMIVEMCLYKDS